MLCSCLALAAQLAQREANVNIFFPIWHKTHWYHNSCPTLVNIDRERSVKGRTLKNTKMPVSSRRKQTPMCVIAPSWCCQRPRPEYRPRHNLHHTFTANPNFYLVQLSLGGLSQCGVHRAPKGLNQSIGIHYKKTLLATRIFRFQTSISSQATRTWTHGSPVTRRERKQWMKYPDRSAPNLCNTNIRRQLL